MTPRALLTAIGATAMAFAVAIGVATDSTFGVDTGTTEIAVSAAATSAETIAEISAAGDGRLAAWNDPCVIAV